MADHGKKNLKAIAVDIADGFISINPLFLKAFNEESIKALYNLVLRIQTEIRTEPFPYNEIEMIRKRSVKLQRLYNAITIMKNYAREKKFRFSF